MMRVLLCVALFGISGIADNRKVDPLSKEAKKEIERLQGKWNLREAQRRGEKDKFGDKGPILEIKATKWIFDGRERGELVAFFPATDPKSFDLKSVEEGRKGELHEGIYKIEGDTLTVCINEGKGKQRPTRFEATFEQPDTTLAVYKRKRK